MTHILLRCFIILENSQTSDIAGSRMKVATAKQPPLLFYEGAQTSAKVGTKFISIDVHYAEKWFPPGKEVISNFHLNVTSFNFINKVTKAKLNKLNKVKLNKVTKAKLAKHPSYISKQTFLAEHCYSP